MKHSKNTGAAKNHRRQIEEFYTAKENTLWFTLHDGCLYWCFSEAIVSEEDNNTDYRKKRIAIKGWSNEDMTGHLLDVTRISSLITKTHSYRGTICEIEPDNGAFDYLVKKINCEQTGSLKNALQARNQLIDSIEKLIGILDWREFEILIDLLFRQAGWQRLGELGGQQKTFDSILFAPITGAKYGVQVKVSADKAEFENWKAECRNMKGLEGFYFAVHKPKTNLHDDPQTDGFNLLLPSKIAELSVNYGLTGWILEKSR